MRETRRLATIVALGCMACFHVEKAQAAAPADSQYRYHYVSLDQAELPTGFEFFFPGKVVDNGRVYGTAIRTNDPDGCSPSVAVWQNGRVSILADGFGGPANNSGTVGG